MENFKLMAAGIDVQPALAELSANAHLWPLFTLRQDTPGSPHHDTECIVLRGPSTYTLEAVFNDLAAEWLPYADTLPELKNLVAYAQHALGDGVELGRVMVVNLKAGGAIDEHYDDGAYAAYYDRFHIVLSSDDGNEFHCGGEEKRMRAGEMWQFNHHIMHRVLNQSNADRVHLIIDARLSPAGEQ